MSGVLTSVIGSLGGTKIKVIEKAKTTSTASGTALTSGAITTTAGRIYIVMLAYDPSGAALPTVTLNDTANTYTALAAAFTAPATTTAGGGVITQSFITTAGATATRTITATFSAAITVKVMTVIELTGATTTQRNVATTSRGTTLAPNYFSPTGNISDMTLTVLAQETNTANTATSGETNNFGGTWSTRSVNSTTGGNALSNISLSYQYRSQTINGSLSGQWTMASTNNWASQSFTIQAA